MRKLTLLIVSLLCYVGVLHAQALVADGVYTLSVDVNQQRGEMVAADGYNYPVLDGIDLGGYTGNSTPAQTNGQYWYVQSVDASSNTYYIYNIAKGKYLVNENGNVNFGNTPYVWTFVTNAGKPDYLNIKDESKTDNKVWLSSGCGRNASQRPVQWDSNNNDGGALYTFTFVSDYFATPEAGKFYKIKGEGELPWLTANATNGGNVVVSKDEASAGVFLKTAGGIQAVATGKYLGYTGGKYTYSDTELTIELRNTGDYLANYNNRYAVVSGGNYMFNNNNDGVVHESNVAHDLPRLWAFIEVEAPAATVNGMVYRTLQEAADAVEPGQTLTLWKDTDAAIVLPLGVILDTNGHAADNVTVATPVAKVGDKGYASLAEAVAAAPAGGTVTLVADVTEAATVKFTKNLTFDGDNHTFIGRIELGKSSGTYTIKNVKFNGKNDANNVYAVKSTSAGTKLTVENCTSEGYDYGFLYLNKAVTTVIVKGVTVTGDQYGVHTVKSTTLTLDNYKAYNTVYPVYAQNQSSYNVTLKNCSFTGSQEPIRVWERNQTNKVTFNFKGVNEMGKADFCTSAMANIVAGGQVATKVYETLNVDALATAKASDLVKLYADTDVEYVLPREVNLEKNNFNAPNLSVERAPAGHVAYRADVTDNAEREGIAILLKDPYAKNSLVVKVYNGETLMFTCTRRETDDEGKVMFPVTANTTANIVLSGKESGSWINEILVPPTELNIPNRVEIWADDVLVQNYTHTSGTILGENLEKYLALDCVKKYDAKVGENYYETLADAVAAAEAGQTVELRKDATGAGVVINKSITIDFNEKTYTVNAGVGSTGTETLGLQILKENTVTLKNGTLTSEGENIKMLVQNYANLTVDNMKLVDATDAIQYVLSNNCGEVAINNSVITSDAIALDACKYASYAAPVVTVDANSVVTGDVEVSATLNMNGTLDGTIIINAATGTVNGAEGLTVKTNVADHKVVNNNGAYTVAAKNYVAQVGEAKYETFAEAVAAAKNGETITLLQAVAESVTITQTAGKSFTIDGDGNDFTGKITVDGKNRSTGAESVTFKNVNFSGGNKSYLGKNSSHNVAFENCTFESKSSYYMHSESAIYNYSFIDCKATGDGAFSQFTKAVNNLYVENFVSECSGNTFKIDYCATSTSVKTATFKNVEIKSGVVGFYISNRNYGKVVFEDVKANCQYPVYMWDRGTGIKTPLEFNGVNEFVTTAEKPWLTGENAANITAAAMIAIEKGNVVYGSFDEALAAVKAGETLTLLRDVTASDIVTIDKAITLEGNGKTLTSTAARAINVDCAGEVAIKNLTVATASSTERAINVINKPATLTLENVVAEGFKYTINVAASSVGSNIAINGGKYSGYAALNITADNTTVNAVDAAFVGVNNEPTAETNSYAAINIGDGSIEGATAGVTVNVSGNSTITAQRSNEEGKGNDEYILIAQDVENANVSLDAALDIIDGKVVMIDDIMDATVAVRAEYADALNTQGFATATNDNGMAVITHPVAKIGNKSYASLAAAVAAAPAGGTVTLVADATEAATVILTKNLTIDGAGKTFTGAIEFKKNNGYFTIKNVNFNGAGNRVYALKSQSSTTSLTVEGCTATGYTYGFLYANSAIANVTVTDVTVKDVNYGVHSARGTNVTLNNFVAENVAYGVMVQNYSGRKVVLNNCSFTGSENPLYIWERNQTYNVTFNFEGVNEMGKADFCTSAMAVINADAIVGTKVYTTLAAAVEAANAGETVALLRNVQLDALLTIDKSITLDLGKYNITRDARTALYVEGDDVKVTINGEEEGTVSGKQALYVGGGLVKVYGGNFHGLTEAVYVQNSGKAEIYGGKFSSDNVTYVLNEYDKTRETSDITVYGGTFTGFNPADNAAEGDGTNFVAESYVVVDNGDGTFSVVFDPSYGKAAKVGDDYYETFEEAYTAAEEGATIELLVTAVFTEDKTLAKNVTLKAAFDDIAIRVQNGATVDFAGTSVESNDYCVILGSSDKATAGYVNISAGTFKGETTAVSVTKGNLNITGGEFQVEPYEGSYAYTINCYDASYNSGDAAVVITGGKFYNFNPADNAAEGAGTNFVTEGYVTGADAEGWWTVAEPVAVIGETGYISISHAFAAAKEGDTVTMIADVELGLADAVLNDAGHKVLAKVAGKNITFDMNGKKISVDHRSTKAAERIFAVICVEDGAGLTVTGEGSIDITTGITDANTMPKVAYMFWKRGTTGYLVIENGNFHMDNSEDSMVYTNGDQIVTVKGGTFTLDAVGLREKKEGFPWIFNADGRNERSIVVTGGTYNNDIREQWYKKEVLIPEEFLVLPNDNGTWTVMGAAAHIGNSYYSTFAKAYEEAVDGDVIELIRTAVVTEDMTLDKNVTVKAAFDDIAIRVQDGATVDFAGTSVESDDYCVILGSSDKATAGYVNISAGTFKGETTAVSVTKGNLNITGGEFQVEPYEGSYVYTINCYDASYNSGDATVAITGGKFYNFNPADNAAEGAGTNFIPEAKRDVVASGVDAEDWWTVAPAVAEVAGNVYISLVDAVAAAGNNDVVTLLQNVTGAGVVINKSITIDFNGKTYTANAGVGSTGTETLGLQILKNNTVTLKNGTLTSEGENIKMLINNYANLTVEKMNLVDATDAIQYVLSNNCGEVAINNSVITSDAVALDACKYASYDAPVVTVDANSVVAGNVEVSATLNMNGTLNGAIVINGKDGVVNAAEGLTVTTDIADYKVVYADGAYTVIPKDYIAQVGNVKYEYIDEAVAAGNYVTILKNFTAAGLVIDKDLTIDFAGHTYTFNEAVGKYNGLLINKGKTVTLKNGTLNVAPEAAGKFYTIIQNYANLTIESMHLDGTNLDMWALTDGDSYVLTSNSGKVVIEGNTNITANNDGDNAYAFNAYDKTAEGYSATKVTVETTGFINGKIEKTGSNPSIVIKSGRYIFNVTKWCADGVAAVEQTDGTWLVTSVVAKVQNNDGVYGFATLPAAVAAADEGATITLMADVTLDEVIKVEKKNLTFELGYKTITANCRKAFEIFADATFRNGNINAVNRCIDTRTKVTLTLFNVTLNANDYTTEYGNPQPLTIGGYDHGTTVNIQNSRINAKDGYGIITFVKSNVNITSSSRISGYNALYAKEGSAGSVFNVNSSTLTGDCLDNDVEGNSFSAIAIQENNVTVKVNSNSTVNANGNNMYAVSIGNEENTSWTGNVVEIKGHINGSILDVENLKDNRVTVLAEYGDRLLDEGYSYDKVDNSYIRAKQVVTLETLDLYDTMDEYVQNEVVLNVKTLTYKRTFKSTAINKWQALYVPFDVPVSELIARGYDVAYPNDFRETVVNGEIVEDKPILELLYIKTGTLKANYPYLIKPTTTAALNLELVLSDVTMGRNDKENMNVVECSSVTKKFEFFGNYKKGTRLDIVGSNDIPFYVMSSGELKQLNYGSPLGAFRFYMVATMKDGSPYYADMAANSIAVRVVGEENEDGTTTIYDVPEEVETEDMIFDLHGRRVLETEKGGIYIKNGKKFIAQ